MDMSIAILEMGEAWLMEHPDHANRRSMLSFTGQCYSHFSSQSTKRDYLDKAIKYLREASGIAEWDPRLEYAEDLEALGVAYMDPRMQEELPEYVDRAIEAFQRAVEATTDGLPYLLTRRSGRLAEAYAVRSERNGKSQDIDQSIHLFEETITMIESQLPGTYGRIPLLRDEELALHRMGIAICSKQIFDLKDDLDHLNQSLKRYQDAIAARRAVIRGSQPTNDSGDSKAPNSSLSQILHPFGMLYLARHERTGEESDLDMAIQVLREAADVTPSDDSARPQTYLDLGIACERKLERTKSPEDLDVTIQVADEIYLMLPNRHPKRINVLRSLLNHVNTRYLATGLSEHLEIQIERLRDLFKLTDKYDQYWVPMHKVLMASLGRKAKQTQRLKDSEAAAEATQDYLDLIPEDHSHRQGCLTSLAEALDFNTSHEPTRENIERGIQACKDALELTPEHDVKSNIELLIQQGRLYSHLAAFSMSTTDPTPGVALSTFSEAQDKLCLLEESEKARLQVELLLEFSSLYFHRYQKFTTKDDLDAALRYANRAQGETFENDPRRLKIHCHLAIIYETLHTHTNQEQYLNLSLGHIQDALRLSPSSDPNRPWVLLKAGSIRLAKYRITAEETLWEMATECIRLGLSSPQCPSPDRSRLLSMLGKAYENRYRNLRKLEDLDESINYHRMAYESPNSGDGYRSSVALEVGDCYMGKYQTTQSQEDLDTCFAYYKASAKIATEASLPLVRFSASLKMAGILSSANNWKEAHDVIHSAIPLISSSMAHSMSPADKMNIVPAFTGFASEWASTALSAEASPYAAIEVFEVGRGFILSSIWDLREDISKLQVEHPEKARLYIESSTQLSSVPALGDEVEGGNQFQQTLIKTNVRRSASDQLREAVNTIRKLQGFERFLLPPVEDELRAAVEATSPIAVVNVSQFRCDVILILKSDIEVVPLPGLSINDIKHHRLSLQAPSLIGTAMLKWLWDAVAYPVISALGYLQTPKPGEKWPRIRWILSGPLFGFPIHAAGYHDVKGCSVLDRAISSYSPSLRSFMDSIRSREKGDGGNVKATDCTVVGYAQDLPNVPKEVAEVTRIWDSNNGVNVIRPPPRPDDVLGALKICDVFHFAGHGYTDPRAGLESAILLEDPLKVSHLLEIDLRSRKPFLAYLSACGTGRIRNQKLTDESLHLAAAFQLAGFRHVIGTLWNVVDGTCVKMATLVY